MYCVLRLRTGPRLFHPTRRRSQRRGPLLFSWRGFARSIDHTKDYFGILGLDPSKKVSDSELKKAYFLLAKKFHPDANASKTEAEQKKAADTFTNIQEAYELLSDKNSRAEIEREVVSKRFAGGNRAGPGQGPGAGRGGGFRRSAAGGGPSASSYPHMNTSGRPGGNFRPGARPGGASGHWSTDERQAFGWWQMDMSPEEREKWRQRVLNKTYSRTADSDEAHLRFRAIEREKSYNFAKQILYVLLGLCAIQFFGGILLYNWKNRAAQRSMMRSEADSLREALDLKLARDVQRMHNEFRERQGVLLPTRERVLAEAMEKGLDSEESLSARNKRIVAGALVGEFPNDQSYVKPSPDTA